MVALGRRLANSALHPTADTPPVIHFKLADGNHKCSKMPALEKHSIIQVQARRRSASAAPICPARRLIIRTRSKVSTARVNLRCVKGC